MLPVDRIAIRQKLAEVLDVSFVDNGGQVPQAAYPTPVHTDLDRLRQTLTGHPALGNLFVDSPEGTDIATLRAEADTAWKEALTPTSAH